MLTVRDSDIIRAINEQNNNELEKDFIKENIKDYFKGKDVLLAWGSYGKFSTEERYKKINYIKNF